MTIQEIIGTIIRGEQALKFPLKIESGMVWDANMHHVLDMRGWGYLQYHDKGGGAAAELQDTIGQWVVDTLNAEARRLGIVTI